MKIIQSILKNNPCYKAGVKITVKGLMLHSVGCPQPSASVFVKNWNKETYTRACVHAFIDANSGDVYQTLPWNYRGWHCGYGSKGKKYSAKETHIGVEMCEPPCIKYTKCASFTCSDVAKARQYAKRTYESAVELFAMLCEKYNLDPLKKGVIISHKEGGIMGVATGHADPEHLWKGLGMSYTMDGFRNDVKKAIGKAAPSEEFKPYKVRVSIDDLNIRKGPGTQYDAVAVTGKGAFTIVDELDGWGLLKAYQKNRDGWIKLSYTEKIK